MIFILILSSGLRLSFVYFVHSFAPFSANAQVPLSAALIVFCKNQEVRFITKTVANLNTLLSYFKFLANVCLKKIPVSIVNPIFIEVGHVK